MTVRRLRSVDAVLAWFGERGVRGLATDSRRVGAGDAFIAWPGYATDGRQYLAAARAAGAAACLVEAEGAERYDLGAAGDPAVAAVAGLKALTGDIANAWYGDPSRRLAVVAITGTNGKTSTAWWLAEALGVLGERCGVIGTLGAGEPATGLQPTGLTTPDPVALQRIFKRFADDGFAACAVEASSIGIVEDRLAGSRVAVAVFTNFTQDHLDFHRNMAAYWDAKARLFAWPGLAAAVLNVDDPKGALLAGEIVSRESPPELWTYGVDRPARLRGRGVRLASGGLLFDVAEGDELARVETALIGDYNVANLLAVIGSLRALGHPLAAAAGACSKLTPVPGRMQRLPPAGEAAPEVVVDYAHTPDALDKVLHAIRPLAVARGGALWCVFGCGGDRDAAKRPLMGAIAARAADRVVVTSDNPRSETPATITAQIAGGIANRSNVVVIDDRREAIAHAVQRAAPSDVILIAGKGHEDYQEIAGERRPFSDAAVAQAALRQAVPG